MKIWILRQERGRGWVGRGAGARRAFPSPTPNYFSPLCTSARGRWQFCWVSGVSQDSWRGEKCIEPPRRSQKQVWGGPEEGGMQCGARPSLTQLVFVLVRILVGTSSTLGRFRRTGRGSREEGVEGRAPRGDGSHRVGAPKLRKVPAKNFWGPAGRGLNSGGGREGSRMGWGPKESPPRVGPPKGGGPKCRSFSCLGSSRGIIVVFLEHLTPHKCTFGVLLSILWSASGPVWWGWWGFHTMASEPKCVFMLVLGFTNTTNIHREDSQRGVKRATFFAGEGKMREISGGLALGSRGGGQQM